MSLALHIISKTELKSCIDKDEILDLFHNKPTPNWNFTQFYMYITFPNQ